MIINDTVSLYLLLYLFFLAVFLTFVFSFIFKNRGPWNNPMLFFMVLFITSWSIMLWLEPVSVHGRTYPLVSVTILAILLAVFLAATKIKKLEKDRIRRLKDKKVIEVVTKSDYRQDRILPNGYFWILIIIESLMIIAAYALKHNLTNS